MLAQGRVMKLLLVYLLSLVLFLFTFQRSQADETFFEYYGAKQNEAQFTIQGQLIVSQTKEPTRDQVDPLIRKQMKYMLGLMRSREATAAALYPSWTFTTVGVAKSGTNKYLVKYNLTAKGVFAKGVAQYTFTMPINPQTIFNDSQGKCMEKHAEESNFWYHWEPKLTGCPLVENTHYLNITADLKKIANTEKTYPEYEKMVDNNKTINITMLFGFEKYGFNKWNPSATEDWGVKGYNMQRDFLKSKGFSETVWSADQVAQVYKAKDGFTPYVMEYKLNGQLATVRIRLVLSDTGLAHNSTAFHAFLRDSLAKESVVVYNGHSGIGKNLDLAAIERLRGFKFAFNPNYQVLFLGSCVPYAYYLESFFSRKKSASDPTGSKKLDILSYGKEAIFGNKEDQFLTNAIVRYAANGHRTTYQEIINASPQYFIGVSGDEDNPTK